MSWDYTESDLLEDLAERINDESIEDIAKHVFSMLQHAYNERDAAWDKVKIQKARDAIFKLRQMYSDMNVLDDIPARRELWKTIDEIYQFEKESD